MAVLSFAREEVEVKVADERVRVGVFGAVELNVGVPRVGRGALDLDKAQVEQVLVDVQQALGHRLHGKVELERLVVHLEVLGLVLAEVVAKVPRKDVAVKVKAARLALLLLEQQQRAALLAREALQTDAERRQELCRGSVSIVHNRMHTRTSFTVSDDFDMRISDMYCA